MLQIQSNKIGTALGSERLDCVEHDLREVGFHIIENVITDEEADAAREAVWKMVEEDIANGHDHSYGDGKIRRVWAIVGKSPIFRYFIQHPNCGCSVETDARRRCYRFHVYGEHRWTRRTCRRLAYRLPLLGDAIPVPVRFVDGTDGLDVR